MGNDQNWYTSGDAVGTADAPMVFDLGRYRVLAPIGRGGTGVVYEAEQAEPRRRVAVKVYRGIAASEPQLARFKAEAQRLSELRHPHIAHVIEGSTYCQDGIEIPYYVLELVPGARPITTYASVLGLSIRRRIELFVQVCDAVQHAHESSILHCDLKPENILVDLAGRVKLIDLGISRSLGEGGKASITEPGSGELRGTVPYLSPEQCAGPEATLDYRSDVYALGVVLYELLTETLPYEVAGLNWSEAAHVICNEPPVRPTLRNKALCQPIDTVLSRALEKDPNRRYTTVAALAQDLRKLLMGEAPCGAGLPCQAVLAARRFTRKQWPFAVGLVAIAGLALASIGGNWLDHMGGRRAYERAALVYLPFVPSAAFTNVCIVGVTDSTDLDPIVRAERLDGFSELVSTSFRLLHGRALEKLALTGARVVGCDLFLRIESEYDPAFTRGVDALRRRGIPVVVATPSWSPGPNGRPILSQNVQEVAQWGPATGHVGGNAAWSLHLLLQHRGTGPIPSLALATIAEYVRPNGTWSPEFGLQQVAIHYRDAGPAPTLSIPISQLEQLEIQMPQFGIEEGAFVAQYIVQMPDDAAIQQSIIDYNELFTAPPEALGQRLAGKVVLLADLRQGKDGPFAYPDGRWLPGSYLQAAAIDQVLERRIIRRTVAMRIGHRYFDVAYLYEFLAAAAGAAIGLLWTRRWALALWCLLAAFITTIAGAAAAFGVAGLLFSPVGPVLVLIVVAALVAILGRLRQPII